MTLSRRLFLRRSAQCALPAALSASALATSASANTQPGSQSSLSQSAFFRSSFQHGAQYPNSVFQHGVASGDPLADRVMLWTRISVSDEAQYSHQPIAVYWRVCSDSQLQNTVRAGWFFTDNQRDFTVKVDVDGLSLGRSYYYIFEAQGQFSDIGRTRTLPSAGVEHLRLAFTSCSDYSRGYFNVYRELAKQADLDAVLHLGDYIYEYGQDHGDDDLPERELQPAGETLTLADYRARHACYKADPDSREVHRQHAFIVIWDDHEVANDAWSNQGVNDQNNGGAANHQMDEGDWSARLSAARQAYMEWMPIREQTHNGIYRQFRFGDLVDLSMLDTRLSGRDAPSDNPQLRDHPQRTLLGYQQEQWLADNLGRAQQQQVIWKLIGQQVMVAPMVLTKLANNSVLNHDQWDGYPAARARLYHAIEQQQVDNVLVLTGDIHSSWALELSRDPFADAYSPASKPLALELVTPAVTSPGIENHTQADLLAASLPGLLPHLNFVDFYYRGFVLLDIHRSQIQAQWWAVDNIKSRRYGCECLKALNINNGESRFYPAQQLQRSPVGKTVAALAPDFAADLAFMRRWQPSSTADSSERALAQVEIPPELTAEMNNF